MGKAGRERVVVVHVVIRLCRSLLGRWVDIVERRNEHEFKFNLSTFFLAVALFRCFYDRLCKVSLLFFKYHGKQAILGYLVR